MTTSTKNSTSTTGTSARSGPVDPIGADLVRTLKELKLGQMTQTLPERLLDDPLPWTRMRSVYRLQGLVTRYGPEPVETACSRALDLDVVSVSKIAAMLAKATEAQQPMLPAAAGTGHNTGGGRFARDPGEYAHSRTTPTSVQLTLIPGGEQEGQP